MFLSPEEVAQLTGETLPYMQRRVLKRWNWIFEVAGDGRPVVSRLYAERRLGGEAGKPRAKTQVNMEGV